MQVVVHYAVAAGELVVFSSPPIWAGMLDGRPVERALALDGTDDAVVVVDPPEIDDSCQPYANIFRVDAGGALVWRAELPIPDDWTDRYVEVEQVDGELRAWSWSCYAVTLNSDTGAILSKVFTK